MWHNKIIAKHWFDLTRWRILNIKGNFDALNLLQISHLIKNLETYKIRKNIKNFRSIYKNGKNNYNIWCCWNQKTKISLI